MFPARDIKHQTCFFKIAVASGTSREAEVNYKLLILGTHGAPYKLFFQEAIHRIINHGETADWRNT